MNKLEKGLREMGLSIEELMNNYTYIGGNCRDGLKRWERLYGNEELPEPVDECICGHNIVDNRYLINKECEIIVLGNCCIKRFLPKDYKMIKCKECGASHQNRKVDYCNECRLNYCGNCGKEKQGFYLLCSKCYFYKNPYKA
jgi:hypothetical protein